MASFNKVILVGNLVHDPSMKYTDSGVAIVGFSLAVNYKSGGKDGVYYFEIEAWDKLAESCSTYCGKGNPVLIEGRLKQERWEDEHGNRKSRIKIIALNVQFLKSGKDVSGKDNKQDDVPF